MAVRHKQWSMWKRREEHFMEFPAFSGHPVSASKIPVTRKRTRRKVMVDRQRRHPYRARSIRTMVRVLPHSIEQDLLAVGGHIEGRRSSGAVQVAQLAGLLRRQVEHPEVLRRKTVPARTRAPGHWKKSIALSFNPKPDCRQFDLRAVCSNGQ